MSKPLAQAGITLSGGTSFIKSYPDMGQDGTKVNSGPRSVSEILQGTENEAFAVHFESFPETENNSHSIAFLLTVDGEPTNFRSYSNDDFRKNPGYVVVRSYDRGFDNAKVGIKPLTFTKGLPSGGLIQLKVFRMDKCGPHSIGLDPRYGANFLEGQLIKPITSEIALGVGHHFVVKNNRLYYAEFLDKLSEPIMTFNWKYFPKEVMEALLIIPRPPLLPDFKILSDPARFDAPDLQTPVPDNFLTENLSLSALDNLAFDFLDQVKFKRLDSSEIEEHMRYTCNEKEFTGGDFREFVEQRFNKRVLAVVHAQTLKTLTYLEEDSDAGFVNSAYKATSQFSTETVDSIQRNITAGWEHEEALARRKAAAATGKDMRAITRQHCPYLSETMELCMPWPKWKNLGVKRLLEERYFRAKVQVIRVLAEKRLMEL